MYETTLILYATFSNELQRCWNICDIHAEYDLQISEHFKHTTQLQANLRKTDTLEPKSYLQIKYSSLLDKSRSDPSQRYGAALNLIAGRGSSLNLRRLFGIHGRSSSIMLRCCCH